jgi:hypothetical protein
VLEADRAAQAQRRAGRCAAAGADVEVDLVRLARDHGAANDAIGAGGERRGGDGEERGSGERATGRQHGSRSWLLASALPAQRPGAALPAVARLAAFLPGNAAGDQRSAAGSSNAAGASGSR